MRYPASVNEEIATYAASIRTRLERVVACLDGLSAAQLNWRPTVDEGNSPYALAAHTMGNARAWVLGIASGHPIERDRPSEFASAGNDAAAFRAAAERYSGEMADALAGVTAADLDRRLVPAKVLWGENEPHEISVRHALVQVIEHASLHLGHLEMTRDLLLAARSGR
jgi:hypothetical protein